MDGREQLKTLASIVCRVVVLPIIGVVRIMGLVLNGEQAFQTGAQAVSLIPGVIGNYVRKEYYRATLVKCSDDVCIEFGTVLNQSDIELGRRVYIGSRCSIGECVIEEDAVIGSNVDIISGRSQHNIDHIEVPIREQGGVLNKIVIGADCWIGNSAIIMANVGKKSVIGAGSVVVRPVDPYSIAAGNPARILRKRQEIV